MNKYKSETFGPSKMDSGASAIHYLLVLMGFLRKIHCFVYIPIPSHK